MKLLELVKERYNRQARLAPALIVLLPLVLVVLVLFPQLRTTAAAFLSLLVSFGGLVFLTQLGRDRGKRIEPRLFTKFGGKPSVAMLRHRDTNLPQLQKARYHQFLATALGTKAPTVEDENADPTAADEWYETASNWLVAKTRDTKKFALLFEENVNYGFRRNLYGLKPAALTSGIGALLCGLLVAWLHYRRTGVMPADETVIALVGVLIYLAVFIALITPNWVHLASLAYARRLLEACDLLPAPGGAAKPAKVKAK